MNDDTLLTLHCPQCKEITEVVTEGDDLVCLDCGWKFDEKTVARFFDKTLPQERAEADHAR
jgi:phage FluMu protein Com